MLSIPKNFVKHFQSCRHTLEIRMNPSGKHTLFFADAFTHRRWTAPIGERAALSMSFLEDDNIPIKIHGIGESLMRVDIGSHPILLTNSKNEDIAILLTHVRGLETRLENAEAKLMFR